MIYNQIVTWTAFAILAMFFFQKTISLKQKDKKTEREREGMKERQNDKKTILRQKKAGSKKTKK